MSNIFISYSRNDLEIAEKIVSVLAESKLDTWIDWKSIPKGEKFGHEIYQGIEGATVFLFLISPNSVQSEWCQKEISHALQNKKRIIPIVIKDTNESSIPAGILERNWIHCRENRDDFNKAITEVLNTIHTDYEWVKYHTKLQVKALDWERRSNKDDTSLLIRGRELQEAEQKLASMGSQKDPQPTDLQRNFVFTSRKAEQSRRKTITGIVAGASIIFCLLCMIAIVGGGVAYIQSNLAKENELARATAQDTAFSRDLAIVAQSLDSQSYESLVLKTLLSIESLKRSSTSSLAVENIHGLSLPKKINSIPSNTSENGGVSILDGVFTGGDGKALAAGYYYDSNSTLQIWDVESGEVLNTWDCANKVASAKFSKDGKFIAVACEGDIISIFDLIGGNLNSFQYETGSIFALDVRSGAHRVFVNSTEGSDWWLNGDTGEQIEFQNSQDVSFLTLSQDGSMVAGISLNGNKELYVWDVNSGNLKWTITAKDKFDISAFSNSGQFLVIGGDNSISIWSLADGTLQRSFPFDTAWFINDLKINTDDTKIGVASSSGLASIIDVETGEQIWSFSGHQAESISFSPDGIFVAVSDREGTTLVADIASNRTVSSFSHTNAKPGSGLQFSPYSTRVLALEYGSAALWDFSELGVSYKKTFPVDVYMDPKSEMVVSVLGNEIRLARPTSSQPDRLLDIGFTPQRIEVGFEAGVMAFADADGKIHLYSINDGNLLGEIDNKEGVYKMAISPSGNYLVVASVSNVVNIFDLNTRQFLAQARIDEVDQLNEWTGFIFSPGEERLLVLKNKFYSLEMPSGRLLYSIHPVDLVLSNIAYSPDGNYIAFSEKNAFNNSGTTCIYDADSGEKTFCNNGYFAGSVQFSKDGNFLYQDSYDDEIFVWDVRTGEIIEQFQDLSGPILLGPDANIVVYSRDTNAKTISVVMLDVVSKTEAFRITRNVDYLQVLGFSDDTKRLVVLERNFSQEQNDTAVITAWYWQSIDMISEGCQRVYRNLTTQEWEKYLPGEPWRITCENIQQP